MPKIQLRFVTTADPVSAMIRSLTDCPFSHIEFVLDEDWRVPSTPIATFPFLNQWTLGAHIEHGIILRQLGYDTFTRVEFATIECTQEQKVAAIKGALACIGSPYDVADIAGILFHQNWSEKGHFICSVFVAKILIEAGIPVLRITGAIDSITPRDVYISPMLDQ